jgi:DNA-binding winged helix-turn-helix (wHTH) protein
MAESSDQWFENFRVDLDNEGLWRGNDALPLTPKAFALLRYLVEHPGQLVTRANLLNAVWPDAVVGDAVLTVGIGELRKAFGDDPQAPRFIETVPRRGYRWIAEEKEAKRETNLSSLRHPNLKPAASRPQSYASRIVGRETALAQLQERLDKALHGERQLVFVTGEPGIGKTTVIEAFLEQVAASGQCWLGQGQCIEHFGVGEPYFPVFAVLGQLCRVPAASRVREILSQYAPTWLVQMPGLLDVAALEVM